MGLEGMTEDVIRKCDVPLNGEARFGDGMTLVNWKTSEKFEKDYKCENGISDTGFNHSMKKQSGLNTGIKVQEIFNTDVRRFLNNFHC
jgi:hypothetical protein